MTPVTLEPKALRSQVKHSTTELPDFLVFGLIAVRHQQQDTALLNLGIAGVPNV